MRKVLPLVFLVVLGVPCSAFAKDTKTADTSDKPRVFISDSQSWEIGGQSFGANGVSGSRMGGGARPQTAEIIKTFGERCPQVVVNNVQTRADYIVLLDHEGGKSFVRHKNKVAVFARVSGDSIVSKSTVSLGGSVQDACEAITQDWVIHAGSIKTARADELSAATATPVKAAAVPPVFAPAAPAVVVAPAAPTSGKLTVTSNPDGADIEIDGSFVGDTPSDVQLAEGEHTVTVRKAGCKDWERRLRISGGSAVHLNAELEKAQ